MAKTFGKLNKSNKMNNVVNNGMVITKGQETFRAEELLNGTITKESFLKMGKLELPAAIKANPLMVLALSYDQDSKVGICYDTHVIFLMAYTESSLLKFSKLFFIIT